MFGLCILCFEVNICDACLATCLPLNEGEFNLSAAISINKEDQQKTFPTFDRFGC